MSHPEQRAFFQLVAEANRDRISSSRVLEIGSYDVNGTIRDFFPAADYVGVDLSDGPGVDVIAYGHDLDYADASFDIVLSGECFEHDPHWQETFANMVRLVRPGGLVAFTCAGRGRPEHGTTRTLITDSPGTQSEGIDYYRNLSPADFRNHPSLESFDDYGLWRQARCFDLYFAGIRKGGQGAYAIPTTGEVERIRSITDKVDAVARLPLRLLVRLLPDDAYQSVALMYWPRSERVRNGIRRRLPRGTVS